jgi:hypothetical protein
VNKPALDAAAREAVPMTIDSDAGYDAVLQAAHDDHSHYVVDPIRAFIFEIHSVIAAIHHALEEM